MSDLTTKKGALRARNGIALLLAAEEMIEGVRRRGQLLLTLGPDGAQLLAELHEYLDRALARTPGAAAPPAPAPDSPHLEWSKDVLERGHELAEQLPSIQTPPQVQTGSGGGRDDDSVSPRDDREGVTVRRRL